MRAGGGTRSAADWLLICYVIDLSKEVAVALPLAARRSQDARAGYMCFFFNTAGYVARRVSNKGMT
jgi:hypothetical protein